MLRIILLVVLIIPFSLSGQNKKTYLSFEVGGSGMIASVNMGRTLFISQRYNVVLQSGLGWSPRMNSINSPFNIPVQLTCNFGNNLFFFEAGLGSSLLIKRETEKTGSDFTPCELYLMPLIGFRYETKKWFVRFYMSPFFNVTGDTLYDDITSSVISLGIAGGIVL